MEQTPDRETPEARKTIDNQILAEYARSHDVLDAMVPRFDGGRQVPLNERIRHATSETSEDEPVAEASGDSDEPGKEWRELRAIDRALDPTIPGDGTTGAARSGGSPPQHYPGRAMIRAGVLLACLIVAACGPRVPTTRIRHQIELRINNEFWADAKVYIRSGSGGRGYRIANVLSASQGTVWFSPRTETFQFYVTFLAAREKWFDAETWDSDEVCYLVVIRNALPHSYVTPCYDQLCAG